MNQELSDVQAGFRKRRGTRDKIANIHWIIEKVREFQKNINFCYIDHTKVFGIINKAEVDVFWNSLAFSIIQWMLTFSKSSLNIWKFMVHIPLKPSLEDFEHDLASM